MKYTPHFFLFLACSIARLSGFSQVSNTICFDNEVEDGQSKPTGSCLDWRDFITIDTINYPHNIWKVGKPQKSVLNTAKSFPNALITDPVNPYPPNDTSLAILTFRLLDPYYTTNWSLWFDYLEDFDSNAYGRIDFSDDNGLTWRVIEHYGAPLPPGVTGLSTSAIVGDPWFHKAIMFDRTKFAGHDSLKLKFTFMSGNDTSGRDGWLIDNICLNSTSDTRSLTTKLNDQLFPNPAFDILHIRSDSRIVSIVVKNMNMQTVLTGACNSRDADINVSGLPTGHYFVAINGSYFGRFVKN